MHVKHYENISIQCTEIFKIVNFLIFAQNILGGGSNEYPQSMFMSKNKKNIDIFQLKNSQLLKLKISVYCLGMFS